VFEEVFEIAGWLVEIENEGVVDMCHGSILSR
jgi:hypothetical protein